MRLSEWNDRARFKCDDCHVHVVSHVCRIDETGGRPFALSPWHRRRRNVLFVHDQSVRSAKPFYGLVELADPVETNRTVAAIEDRPVTVGRDKGVPPGNILWALPASVRVNSPSTTKKTPSAFASSSGLLLPPPAAISTIYCENVSANPDSGRDKTQSRVFSQNGKQLVTMSRIVPFGMTA